MESKKCQKRWTIAGFPFKILFELIRNIFLDHLQGGDSMAERLKDIFFTRDSMAAFADTIGKVYPNFNKRKFLDLIYDGSFKDKEFMERSKHITRCLHEILPKSYKKALDILTTAAPLVKGVEALSLPDYVATYGMDDMDLSLPALGRISKYITAELAIRPFLDKDPKKVMALMVDWAGDKNDNLRRLASEGCRPRLPWAIALPKFKKDPTPILPVLEKLKNDKSENVRRSVANNLNDISKDNPEIALAVCEQWYGQSAETDKIVKHACRTLLKAGDKRALMIFGYSDPSKMKVTHLKLDKNRIKIGENLNFSFDLTLEDKGKVRLEYAVFYVKANGKLSKKVFKMTENSYKPGTFSFSKKQFFGDMTTRKHYPGTHVLSIIINGEEKDKASFELSR
jgi:3-methyladenine DNA glycosylase AlkC